MNDEDILANMEAAYKKTGLKPADKIYVREGMKKACPLGALCEERVPAYRSSRRKLAAFILAKTEDWCRGFEAGFDGIGLCLDVRQDDNYYEGFRLGEKARQRFLKETNES